MFNKLLTAIFLTIIIYSVFDYLQHYNGYCDNGRYQAIIKTNHYSTSKSESVVVYDTRTGNIYRYN